MTVFCLERRKKKKEIKYYVVFCLNLRQIDNGNFPFDFFSTQRGTFVFILIFPNNAAKL